jgi:hypothetical protein
MMQRWRMLDGGDGPSVSTVMCGISQRHSHVRPVSMEEVITQLLRLEP